MLSLIAAREALDDAGLNDRSLRIGFVSANTVGGMDRSEKFFADFGVTSNDPEACLKSVSPAIINRVMRECELYGMFVKG